MRTLAIDLGERRVGLAMSDQAGRYASPLQVLSVNAEDQALPIIARLVVDEDVQRIVVGLPLNMDGSIGPRARLTIQWGNKLTQATSLPVVYVDERLSSFDAEQRLIERKRSGEKLTRQRKKQQLDAIAAASFLQDFLDGKLLAMDAGSGNLSGLDKRD